VKEEIVLIGGGGHSRSCIDVIETHGLFHISGIVDKAERVGQTVLGYPIIGVDTELKDLVKRFRNFLITIGQIKVE